MSAAYAHLARVTGIRPGTELLRAAEDHLIRMYKLIRDNPDSPLIRDLTGQSVTTFLATAEAYLKEAHLWPLPEED